MGVRQADYVTHLASLTLIWRAASPSVHPNERCVAYARQTLDAHQAAYFRLKDSDTDMWEGYVHWAIVHAPFTPFIVVFYHIVATSDRADFERLSQFVESLQSAAEVTDAAGKFYRMCQVFHQFAGMYLDVKTRKCAAAGAGSQAEAANNGAAAPTTTTADGRASAIGVPWGDLSMTDSAPLSEVDQYLGALGFVPPRVTPVNGNHGRAGGAYGDEVGGVAYDAAGLETWFHGNQYMMDLLEQDLSYLDPASAGDGVVNTNTM